MKKIKLLRELRHYPVFGAKKVGDVIEKPRAYAYVVLRRLKKEGLVYEIEKNKYSTHADPLIVASHLVWPSYLSCWTALRFHGLTEQLPAAIQVVTTRSRKNRVINFGGSRVEFIKVKPKFFFGFEKLAYGGFEIFVATPEKALVDCALFKKTSFSTVIEAVKNHSSELDAGKLAECLLRVGNGALAKRFGFLLHKLGLVNSRQASKLKKLADKQLVPLDYAAPAKGRRNKEWSVVENVEF